MGKAFDYKWIGNGIAHPDNKEETQQALHWARLAAKHDPNYTSTLIFTPDKNWYQHSGPFPGSHIIALFQADSLPYEEPTISPKQKKT